jgi:hypothetical protein
MNDPNDPIHNYSGFKKRIFESLMVEMEGTVDPNSPDDMRMFDELLGELLADENIILSRIERKRLHDDLLSSFSDRS